MPVTITAYDGVGVIGGNKILLEADGTALWLDFGINFRDRGLYFEEFLKPRPAFGLGDLLEMGLLPPLRGIYRRDLENPEWRLWDYYRSHPWYRELGVEGILLSHAHVDHSGYISFLAAEIPVYSGLMTAVIAKAMQDTSPSDLEREICYLNPREIKEGLLASGDWRKVCYQQRAFHILDRQEFAVDLQSFWGRACSSRGLAGQPLRGVSAGGDTPGEGMGVGNLKVRFFPVDHSIPGAGAFALETQEGYVVYTGDLRWHGAGRAATRSFVEEASRLRPLVLICEGTHPDARAPVTEEEVYFNSRRAVAGARGLVVADFGPRNVERLLIFHRIARETGRRLGITARDAYLLEAMHAADPAVPDPLADDAFFLYTEARLNRPGWEKDLLERYRGKALTASQVRARPEESILCFSFFDLHELIDIRPAGGIYIYSSSEAFNEEMHIDLDRLRNWVKHFNLRLVGEPGDRDGKGREAGFHASGHIHGPGLIEMVRAIRPQYLLPVHTEDTEFFVQNFPGFTSLVLLERGRPLTLPFRPAA